MESLEIPISKHFKRKEKKTKEKLTNQEAGKFSVVKMKFVAYFYENTNFFLKILNNIKSIHSKI